MLCVNILLIFSVKLTTNDKKTLTLLLDDGRTSDTVIARSLGITKQAVGRIRKKLEKAGIINRYAIQLDYERLGVHSFAIVLASLTDKWLKMGELEATEKLSQDPHLIKIFRASRGEITHILVYAFKNQEELAGHLDKKNNLLSIQHIYSCSHIGLTKDENKELFKMVLGEKPGGKVSQETMSAIDKFKESLKTSKKRKK